MDFQLMSPEEMQRAMQFLVHQQAQFAADIARNETRWAERFDHMVERFDQLSAKTDQIAVGLLGLTGIVGQLAALQQRTDEQLRTTKERVDELGEYIRSVESHLDVVIEMFERHLREDHGRPPS